MGFIAEIQGWFSLCKSISVSTTLTEWNKNDLIILWDAEEAFEKMIPLYDKNSEQLGIEEMYVNIIKAITWQMYSLHHIQWLKKKIISLRSGTQGCPLLPLLLNLALEVLPRAVCQGKERKVIQIRKGEIKSSLFAYDIDLTQRKP